MNFEGLDLNIDGLAGVIGNMSDQELLGAIQANPQGFKRAINAKARHSRRLGQNNSRDEFQARLPQLSQDVSNGLLKGSSQLVDTWFAVAKSISAASQTKMLRDSDVKTAGVCMINGGRLGKGEPFLLSSIILLYGVGSGTTENVATISPINFGQISPVVRGGVFEFKVNGKILIPETSNEAFVNHYAETSDTTDKSYAYALQGTQRVGEFKLENPKLIETQVPMEFNLDWGVAAASNAFLKVILKGTRVFKY
jgi:hypothetical protein